MFEKEAEEYARRSRAILEGGIRMLDVLFIMFCITVVLIWYEAWKIGEDK